MDNLALIYLILFLAAVFPMILVVLYPIIYIIYLMHSVTRGRAKIMEDVKKNGQMVMGQFVHQHRMHYKPASGKDIETEYSYEYKGKKTNIFEVPNELPLYFYRNPKKAFAEGSVNRERVPRCRILLISLALTFVGCSVVLIVCINLPDRMNVFRMYFEELMKKGGMLIAG